MSGLLDVPFLPEEPYAEFLADCGEDLDSVHFSLLATRRLDNRIQLQGSDLLDPLADLLAGLPGVKKYALLNSRFYGPSLFTDGRSLRFLVDMLDTCVNRGVLDGIVYCDHYLLQKLSDAAPDLAASLEAVPGVNTMLDSFAKIQAQLMYIRETCFKGPGKIIVDRSLNRDLDRLAELGLQCRKEFPSIRLEVLANEGCLYHCPYKLSHDAYIALANYEGRDCTHRLNRDLGCMRLVDERPYRILQSPFIRPEDVELYLYHVDTIKLCGRTLGTGFLKRCITAYRERSYTGNLLDLLDALHWLADQVYVDNPSLSFDFAGMLSMCDKDCRNCGFCAELFASVARRLPVRLPDQRPCASGAES